MEDGLGVPIRPDQVEEQKKIVIPAHVFDAFNKCISENYTNGRAHVYQKDIVKEIKKTTPTFPIEWLNVEEAYRESEWDVTYDKPAYCETYDAFFVFAKKELIRKKLKK